MTCKRKGLVLGYLAAWCNVRSEVNKLPCDLILYEYGTFMFAILLAANINSLYLHSMTTYRKAMCAFLHQL